MRTTLAGLVALALAAAPAAAETAAGFFRDGRFDQAAAAGLKENTPESLVIAGRSLMNEAAYEARDRATADRLLSQSLAAFDRALALRPGDQAATLQKGIATGYVAKLARSPGGARAARRLMEAARAKDPNDGLAAAAIGGWHGESIATLGSFIAGTVLGARRGEAIKGFDAALRLDPKSPVHPVFYAFMLLGLDGANAAPRATELLRRAEVLPARDGFEALMKRQAAQVLPLLARGDVRGAQATVKRLQPFGMLG